MKSICERHTQVILHKLFDGKHETFVVQLEVSQRLYQKMQCQKQDVFTLVIKCIL